MPNATYQREYRKKRIAAGLCPYCGKLNTSDKLACIDCRRYRAKKDQKRDEQNKAKKECQLISKE